MSDTIVVEFGAAELAEDRTSSAATAERTTSSATTRSATGRRGHRSLHKAFVTLRLCALIETATSLAPRRRLKPESEYGRETDVPGVFPVFGLAPGLRATLSSVFGPSGQG